MGRCEMGLWLFLLRRRRTKGKIEVNFAYKRFEINKRFMESMTTLMGFKKLYVPLKINQSQMQRAETVNESPGDLCWRRRRLRSVGRAPPGTTEDSTGSKQRDSVAMTAVYLVEAHSRQLFATHCLRAEQTLPPAFDAQQRSPRGQSAQQLSECIDGISTSLSQRDRHSA